MKIFFIILNAFCLIMLLLEINGDLSDINVTAYVILITLLFNLVFFIFFEKAKFYKFIKERKELEQQIKIKKLKKELNGD